MAARVTRPNHLRQRLVHMRVLHVAFDTRTTPCLARTPRPITVVARAFAHRAVHWVHVRVVFGRQPRVVDVDGALTPAIHDAADM